MGKQLYLQGGGREKHRRELGIKDGLFVCYTPYMQVVALTNKCSVQLIVTPHTAAAWAELCYVQIQRKEKNDKNRLPVFDLQW